MPNGPGRRWEIRTTHDVLVAGNKAGDWTRWYDESIPIAEVAYEAWLAFERKRREGQ